MPSSSERSAHAVWEGSLTDGKGRVRPESGAFPELQVTWAARTGGDDSKTSPEELLAAAHAACFSMALSNGLAGEGHPPERLETSATCTFAPKPEGGFHVSSMQIKVRGTVPGMDAAAFQEAAQKAGRGCPISGAIAGNVDITVEAELA